MAVRLEALLFDVDGTLADTERDGHRVAFNRAFADAGLDWRWDEDLYGELLEVTGGKERMCHYLDRYRSDWPRPGSDKALTDLIRRLHAAKTKYYTHRLAEGAVVLRPGVRRLIAEARAAGMRMAIATTTTPANVGALLEHALGADAQSWFEVIAAGDCVAAKKPAPDIYFRAMERMQLRPEQCLALEDSSNGIRASLAAGLATLITTNDYTTHHDFSGAALVVDQLGEPDRPMHVIRGDAGGASYIDLRVLRNLHRDAWDEVSN